MIRKICVRCLTGMLALFVLLTFPHAAISAAAERAVLCSTFPIYQLTRNITTGREGVQVDLMLPSQLGCPHDYVLSPLDMKKMARADILVINGLGMEDFLVAPLQQAKETLVVVDSSAGIKDLLAYQGDHHHAHHHDCDEHHHNHSAEDWNPHLFASPRMVVRLVENIAQGLALADPDGTAVYRANAETYVARMEKLAEQVSGLGEQLGNKRILQPHGIFDYLARDIGLEIIAHMIDDSGQEPAASEMIRLIKLVREQQPAAIVIEPQYPAKVANTISQETGVPVVLLDPVATGPDDAPLDYYETIMRQNLETIAQTWGVR